MDDSVYRFGPLAIDRGAHLTTINGQEVKLAKREYGVLCLLATNAGKMVSEKDILETIWGPDYFDEKWYIHVVIYSLRKKLSLHDATVAAWIVNIYGEGYVLRV